MDIGRLTYARQIFEVLCVLRVPWELPDATDVHLETGLERDLLWSLTWARIKIIECFKSLSLSTDLCQTDFWSPLGAQGSLRASRRQKKCRRRSFCEEKSEYLNVGFKKWQKKSAVRPKKLGEEKGYRWFDTRLVQRRRAPRVHSPWGLRGLPHRLSGSAWCKEYLLY